MESNPSRKLSSYLSAIIICYNSENTIEQTLASLDFVDEIVVVDSYSTDKTVEICEQYTQSIFQKEWAGYSRQKQFAMEKSSGEWILWIDSDEEVSPDLAKEISDILKNPQFNGYHIPRKTHYLGKWINHGGWYPDYCLRLFKKSKATFTDQKVHESVSVKGPISTLKNDLWHYSYRDISHHLQKIDEFSTLAAEEMNEEGQSCNSIDLIIHPISKFIKMYIIRLGMLDGFPGLIISVLGGYYVFLKYAKLWELQQVKEK